MFQSISGLSCADDRVAQALAGQSNVMMTSLTYSKKTKATKRASVVYSVNAKKDIQVKRCH
jgi:hypothetical protein